MKKSILLYAVLLLATMLILLTSCGTHDTVPPAEADTSTPADTTTQSTSDSTTPSLPDYTLTPSLQSVDQIQSFGLISADGTIVEACSRVSGGYSVSFIQEDGTPVFGPVEGNVFLDIPKKLPSDCPVLKINDFELINKTGAEITDDYYIPFDPKDVLRIYDTPQEPGLYFRTIRTKSAGPIEDESIPAVAGELYLNYTYFFAVVVE